MSLDVTLTEGSTTFACVCEGCGHQHVTTQDKVVYESNITLNLNTMADAAGMYYHLWRPEEVEVTTARQLIQPLHQGLAVLRSDPERFRRFDASNGWGRYDDLVRFVESYVRACEEYPDATVSVSR